MTAFFLIIALGVVLTITASILKRCRVGDAATVMFYAGWGLTWGTPVWALIQAIS